MIKNLVVLLLSFVCMRSNAQIDLIPELNQRFIHLYNWVEYGNNYYFLTWAEGSSSNQLSNGNAIEYTINKYNKISHQFQASQVIAGDTSQADSVIYYFSPTLVIKNDKIHFAFTSKYLMTQ